MIPKEQWEWMPHAAHFILGNRCEFRLATKIGKYIVSTVGEYIPDSNLRDILAECKGIKLEGIGDAREYSWRKQIGFEEIGYGRKYETMVFKAEPSDNKCCPWSCDVSECLDSDGYNDAGEAREGHLELCEKWSSVDE